MLNTCKNLSRLTAILFALSAFGHASQATAASIVTNCNDSGPGSLRAAVESAPFTGETIDLTRLGCARITLTSGVIEYHGTEVMEIVGPGKNRLTLDGAGKSGIFFQGYQTSKSTLRISDLTLTNGLAARGGCVETLGNLELLNVSMHHCKALGPGGGVYAFGNALVDGSTISDNRAGAGGINSYAFGGGLFVSHNLELRHSRVSGNKASAGNNSGHGGGVFAGGLKMKSSVLDHNIATNGVGGAYLWVGDFNGDGHPDWAPSLYVWNSTISDNWGGLVIFVSSFGSTLIVDSTISRNRGDDIILVYGDATIVNSTIAFNRRRSLNPAPNSACRVTIAVQPGAGVPVPLHLESTIVASNDCRFDLVSDVLIGSHNLVEGASFRPLPTDTIRVSPRLGPLVNNGGPTPTHALLCDSPAIDRGNNILNLAYDQRGKGFPRVKGGHADIGAYER